MASSKFTVLHRDLPCLLMLRLGRKYSIAGIKLVVPLQTRERAEKIRTKLVRAFTIIQQHTPKLYKRVEKFIPNILVFGVHPPYSATYIADLALCDVSRDYALADSTSPEALATTNRPRRHARISGIAWRCVLRGKARPDRTHLR